jgi:hypothetical protein
LNSVINDESVTQVTLGNRKASEFTQEDKAMDAKNNIKPFNTVGEAVQALKSLRSDAQSVAARLTVSFIKGLKPSELEQIVKAAPRAWRVWIKYAARHGSASDSRSARTLYNSYLDKRKDERAKAAKPTANGVQNNAPIDGNEGNTTPSTPNDTATNTPNDTTPSTTNDTPSTNDAKATSTNDASTTRDLISEVSTMTNQEMASILMSIAYADNIQHVMALLTTHALQKLSSAISDEVHRRAEARRTAAKERRAKAKDAKNKPADTEAPTPDEFPAPKPTE